jgi:NAD(P)-dependent dehydrogenase (short-subunit alcohol dehydrogenase family)
VQLEGKICVVTGAAGGIGAAMARRFKAAGAAAVVVADVQEEPLHAVAAEIGGLAVTCDVTKESDIISLVGSAEDAHGPIDVFCSNAGIARNGGEESSDALWQLNWDLHVMAHVYAARAVAPKMAARGSGYLVNTASAAGLLSHLDSATYAVTKHAAVALAEWLAITYGDRGVRVSVLCPQAVRTAMTAGHEDSVASVDGMIEADQVADDVLAAMAVEDFLILPHTEVAEYIQRKAGDYNRWLGGMRKLRRRMAGHG